MGATSPVEDWDLKGEADRPFQKLRKVSGLLSSRGLRFWGGGSRMEVYVLVGTLNAWGASELRAAALLPCPFPQPGYQ